MNVAIPKALRERLEEPAAEALSGLLGDAMLHLEGRLQGVAERVEDRLESRLATREQVNHCATKEDLAALETKFTVRLSETAGDLHRRMDKLEADLGGRMDRLEADLGGRMDRLEADLGGRMDRLEADLGGRMDGIDERFGRFRHEVEGRMEALLRDERVYFLRLTLILFMTQVGVIFGALALFR